MAPAITPCSTCKHSSVHTTCIHQQVTINCAERGLLLLRVRDELRMTTAAYQVRWGSSRLSLGPPAHLLWGYAKLIHSQMLSRLLTCWWLCVGVQTCMPPLPSQQPLVTPPSKPQTLYESSVAFGMRKALLAEQGKGEMVARTEALESTERDLARQVAEWKLKCETMEKREGERREAEAKKHKEEVAYLESYARQLKGQLEALTSTAGKKAAAGGAAAT